ncbi:4-hydroxyphenylpyruvate dioxygenase [Labeo rohita]|uniref:4-hydroxyphenylpyruvate dioxygenase n=1 Tax=Labeo rohita TaxID=84645 RepID=A0ABQ8L300_LABRO|nr:4-hydroxyphenylpyruvate dioxygenase [Labeo rohita]
MVPGRDQEDFRDLPPSVVNTLLQARAPSTRRLYDLKWRIFVNWCSSQGKDPRRCGIKSVLSFFQGGLDRHLSASTLKVHMVAISANHDLVEGRSTALLTALTSVKRVEDLQALSVNSLCLEFRPADSGYVPKVPTIPFRDQVVTLQAIPSQEAFQMFRAALCLFRRTAEGEGCLQAKDLPLACGCDPYGLPGQRLTLPTGSDSLFDQAALANGASLTDICGAADLATPNTFARFYNLRMDQCRLES